MTQSPLTGATVMVSLIAALVLVLVAVSRRADRFPLFAARFGVAAALVGVALALTVHAAAGTSWDWSTTTAVCTLSTAMAANVLAVALAAVKPPTTCPY